MESVKAYLLEMSQVNSESTVKNHKSTLTKFVNMVKASEVVEVLPEDIVKFKKSLLKVGTVASANTQLKRIKAFFKWCVKYNLIDFSPAEDVKLTTESMAVPKWLSKEQKGALLRAVKRDYLGETVAETKKSYRELLMVMLMLKAGLRVGEVANLEWKDVKISDRKGELYIRSEKTETHRTVPLTSDTLKVFKAYLEKHGKKGEYVFFSRQSDKVTTKTIENIVSKYSGLKTETAVIDEVTPHMLRHTYAHELALGKMQPEAIARLLGHFKKNGQPNIQQTARYTMLSQSEISDEVEDILGIQ